jgi:hypothetical protein
MTADYVDLAAIISKYLFAAGKGGFARGQFHSPDASIFDELIGNVERWSVAGHGEIDSTTAPSRLSKPPCNKAGGRPLSGVEGTAVPRSPAGTGEIAPPR